MPLGEPKLIKAILRGRDVLKCLADGINQLTDVSQKLNLSKSTIHRILKTLEVAGWVRQDPKSRSYFLGPLVLSLAANPIVAHRNLIVCAADEMLLLRDVSEETVVLHVIMGLQRICLEEVPSLHNIKYTAGVGSFAPIYVGSAGKMLLAELDEAEMHVFLDNIQLQPVGPNKITDKAILLQELTKARELQYAVSFGERVAGSASISVPIKQYYGPACISVLGLEDRFAPRMMEVLDTMKACAANISDKIAKRRGGVSS